MRVLLIAEEANPEWVSVPLVGWSCATAIARRVDAHLVTQIRNAAAFERAGVDPLRYTAIDSERVAGRLYRVATALRGGTGTGWTTNTAVSALSYLYFERLLWKQFGGRIRAGEFDLVHRVTPLSPTIPSPIARRCRRAGVPFILGPLNGGVPWPRGFDGARRKEREWLSYVRGAYKALPGYGSTRRDAAAIICGSRFTQSQIPAEASGRCVYLPENGIDPARFAGSERGAPGSPLRVVFVGRLVPYKGADMLLEAAEPLARAGRVEIEVIGDGPQKEELRGMAARIGSSVTLAGWVEHSKLRDKLARADVLGFPSIREFGGGVVLEAMALGIVPVVVNYGGPGELVTAETGIAVPIGTRKAIVSAVRAALEELAEAPGRLVEMSRRARERAMSLFTWDAKAAQIHEVYRWVLGERPDRPDFGFDAPAMAVSA